MAVMREMGGQWNGTETEKEPFIAKDGLDGCEGAKFRL